MNRHTRRSFAAFIALGVVALFTRCGQTVAQWAADAQTGINAVQAAIGALPASAQASIPEVVSSGLATLKGLFASIATATPATVGTLAQQLLEAGEEALPVLASFFGPYGAAASLAVAGVQAIINAIENDVAAPTALTAAKASLAVPGVALMGVDEARKRFGG